MLAAGKLEERTLRDAALQKLGGLNAAFELIGPDISRLDLLMARLLHLSTQDEGLAPGVLSADTAFIAKWCAAFFDQGQAASPMPNRELGLYRATLAAIAYDTEFRALTGESGQQLLLSVPRDPLEAISEGLVALGIHPGQEEQKLAELVARLPGWAGHIRWRNENADPDIAAGSPAGMADLLALWLLLERGGGVSYSSRATVGPDAVVQLAAHFTLTDVSLEALGEEGHARFAAVAAMDEDSLGAIFQTAAEWSYRNALAPKLQSAATSLPPSETPDAQLVFCIDVRSEPFRRALEAKGRYETFGYLFSTIDNERYGSGDKVTQNVVGGIGVLQGNGGDLKVGLPRQSLFTDDGTPFHVPQRLLTVVLAPFDRVERVVESNDILGRLFGNGWVTLVVIDPQTGKALRWRRDDELDADAPAAPATHEQEV